MPTTPTPTTSHRPSPLATSSTSFATASHAMTRTLSLLFLALSLAACPRGGAETPRQVTIDDLREAAAEAPNDFDAQWALATGELLRDDGDPGRAAEVLARAERLRARDGRVALLRALLAYVHGEPAAALDGFLEAMEEAGTRQPAVAELAASGVEELTHIAPRFPSTAGPRLEAMLADLPLGARQTAVDVLVELAYRRGDVEAVRRHAAAQGCVTEWKVAGPFGPRALLGFDRDHGEAFATGPLPAEVDLGPRRGVRPTREVEGRGCAVHLGAGPIADGGTTYAEAFVDVEEGGLHTLRLETPNSVELRVDGERVLRLDHRRQPLERVTFHALDLAPGRHEIAVKVTTRHPNPILMVALEKGEAPHALPDAAGGLFATYVRGATVFSRGSVVQAREALAPFGDTPASPIAGALRAAIALADPLITSDMRRDQARAALRSVAQHDEAAWFPRLQLARLMAAEGRDLEALAELREDVQRWPELAAFRLTLVQLLLNRGWDAQAAEHIEAAIDQVPEACPPVEAALAFAQRHDHIAEIDRYTGELMQCDARRSERYQQLVQARKWEEAKQELDRLIALEPEHAQARFLPSRLDLAEGRANADTIERVLQAMQEASPRTDTVRLARADRRLAQGDTAGAIQVMNEALEEEPAAMARLRRIRTALGGEFEFEGWRKNGPEMIEAFEASERSYDEPQVLVWDYMVVRVFEDGSSLQLIHQIYKLQSEEAVDAQGEYAPPEDGYMLGLRTIKADGTRLEPDLIPGKETISMPNLAVGDYVEAEYVRVLGPPDGLPNGLLGDRFFFASFELPFDRSELVVILPEGMDPLIDPRGDAPEVQRSTGEEGEVVLRWAIEQSTPLVQEPASVAAREFIPSVNWGVNADWSGFLEGLRDVLADREMVDPAARALAREIVGEATSDEEKARALYYWLLENVENNNDVFGQAAVMLAGRTGNRARVLHYLLGLVDVDSQLVLARGFGSDQTESALADEETYTNLIVRLGEDTYLQPTARGIPFGYVSPALHGQDALVLGPVADARDATEIRLPPATGEEDHHRVEVTADVAPDGSAQVEVVETFQGTGAIQWRNDLEGIPEAVLEQRFEEAYVARMLNGASLESLRITGRENPEEPLVLRYAARVPALAREQGDARVLPGLFPSVLGPRFARTDTRRTTQVVGPPLNQDVVLRVTTPNGAPATAMQPVELEGPGDVRFAMSAEREGEHLVISRSLRVPLMRVSPAQSPRFASWCRAVDEAEAREITLR